MFPIIYYLLFQVSNVAVDGEYSSRIQYYRTQGTEPLVFLADHTNIASIYYAPVLVFDGTFKYHPREFGANGQTYTMHAVYPDLPDRQSTFLCGNFSPYN
jgi:hypothetical protein